MVRIILATLPQYEKMAITLTECNQDSRLLSFYLLKDINDEDLRHYVETGLVLRTVKKRRKSGFQSSVYIRERRLNLNKRLLKYKELELSAE